MFGIPHPALLKLFLSMLFLFSGGTSRCTDCHTGTWISFTMSKPRYKLVTVIDAFFITTFSFNVFHFPHLEREEK
jgi:hypothetical protein